jgi:allophanate hydrolase subunit 1
LRIPAGTIGLSGGQGTIYTIPAPGGWRLIGRTPLRIVNTTGGPFVAIQPGDQLRFVPVSAREFTEIPPRFIGELL